MERNEHTLLFFGTVRSSTTSVSKIFFKGGNEADLGVLGLEENKKSDLEKERKGERGGRVVEGVEGGKAGVEGAKRGEEIPKECIVSKQSTRYKSEDYLFHSTVNGSENTRFPWTIE